MNSLNLLTEKDKKEAARINFRRLREEDRKKRIFDPKIRTIGIDTDILKKQIEENNKKKEDEDVINEKFIQRIRNADLIALAMENKQKQEKIKIEQEINYFRKTHQRPEYRREFDLNDPNYIKKQFPARIGDNDPRLGPSSAQCFFGEDLCQPQRLLVQKEQVKACLEQQIQEKEMANGQRKMAENAYYDAIFTRDRRASQMAQLEQECRIKLAIATQRFNEALSEERKAFLARNKIQTNQDNTSEMFNALLSDLLTENPDVAQSNLGPYRKIPYLYKGMNDEENAEYRKAQLEQIKERQTQRDFEEKLDKQFYDYFNKMQNTVFKLDVEIENEKRKMAKKLEEENLNLAEKQKNQIEDMNRYGLTNVPKDEYFEYFNQSSR